jgi:hypothetical protein
MNRRYQAHRLDEDGWPTVTTEDWKALFWLIAFAVIFVAICAVDPR